MEPGKFESLVNKANDAAQKQDWREALRLLLDAVRINTQHAGALSGIGTCLIQLGRANEAIPYFEQVTRLVPEHPDPQNNLGVAYMLVGKFVEAERAFRTALKVDENNLQVWKNLANVLLQQPEKIEEGVRTVAAIVGSHPEDVDALLMMASLYEQGDDVKSATHLYRNVLKIVPDHEMALDGLKRMGMPVEDEIIPDAARIARPEHARKLAALKGLRKSGTDTGQQAPQKKAVFYSWDASVNHRYLGLAHYFETEHQTQLVYAREFKPEHIDQYDELVFADPNLSGELVGAVSICLQKQKKFMLDLDQDFHQIPEDHPAYAQFGLGNPRSIQALEMMLSEATVVFTASAQLKEVYAPFGKQVIHIPSLWKRDHPWWEKPSPKREKFAIGWMGGEADLPDLQTIQKPLLRFFREHENCVFMSIGSPSGVEAFSALPEWQKQFLPIDSGEDIPYLLAQLDVLIIPLRQNYYNHARSDYPLMIAGARGLPWVGSDIPAFKEWGAGGILVEKDADWGAVLDRLITDESLRAEFARQGKAKAEERLSK